MWKRSQRCREFSYFLCSITRLTCGRGCSREDGAEEPVRSAGNGPSTRTARSVGRYVVCVGHSLDAEVKSRKRKNTSDPDDSGKGSLPGYVRSNVFSQTLTLRPPTTARTKEVWMWTGIEKRSNSQRLGKLCFVSCKSALKTLPQPEKRPAVNYGGSSRQILRKLSQEGRRV